MCLRGVESEPDELSRAYQDAARAVSRLVSLLCPGRPPVYTAVVAHVADGVPDLRIPITLPASAPSAGAAPAPPPGPARRPS